MTRLHELQEKRASLVTEMRALADKADLEANEQSRFDTLKGELRSLETKITNAQTVAAFERHADATPLDGERRETLRKMLDDDDSRRVNNHRGIQVEHITTSHRGGAGQLYRPMIQS